MWLAYVDESGDLGRGRGASPAYALAAVLVKAAEWPDRMDALIDFRRALRDQFGIPPRVELKAYTLTRGSGLLNDLHLNDSDRLLIFRQHLHVARDHRLGALAVVIRKDMIRHADDNVHGRAWEYLLQRFERLTTRSGEPLMIIHDDGDAARIRRAVRKARRAGTAGSAYGPEMLHRPARLLIEDPVPRASHESYFLQVADLCAYAAFRRICPIDRGIGTGHLWDELGAARHHPANELKGDPSMPGIVVWPGIENPRENPGA